MRVTGTLYVTDHRARIRLRRGTLVVEQTTGWQRVPIEALDGVIITGRAEISNDALGELVRRNVRVAAISKTGRLRFAVGGPVSGNVHLRVAQVNASMDPSAAASVARWIVAGKLQNCRRSMQRWSWEEVGGTRRAIELEVEAVGERIGALAGTSDGDKIRGIEGDGSRRYFTCLGIHLAGHEGPMSFVRRSRRPPRDPVNALLSFIYGLLVTELVGALDAVGLDPQIGFLHRPRSGRPSLALDILEEFRPALADRFAIAALGRCQVREEHFKVAGGAYYLNDEGRATVLERYEEYRSEEVSHPVLGHRVGRWTLPTVQATLLARYLRGDLPAYPPFVMAP
jgi:CRISPR-associated protein Cas1